MKRQHKDEESGDYHNRLFRIFSVCQMIFSTMVVGELWTSVSGGGILFLMIFSTMVVGELWTSTQNGYYLLLVTCYLPPPPPPPVKIGRALDIYPQKYDKILLTGDFNAEVCEVSISNFMEL